MDEAAQTAREALYKQRPNQTLRQRCQRVLLKAAGRPCLDVGQVVGLCRVSVDSWVKRYQQEGIKGLETKPGRGRKLLLPVAHDQVAVRHAVAENRQRLPLAKAEGEPQRTAEAPAVSREALRPFLNGLVAAINASDDDPPPAPTPCAMPTGSSASASWKRWPRPGN